MLSILMRQRSNQAHVRLWPVFMRLHPVQLNDFPEGEFRRRFVGIRDDLTFDEPSGDEGRPGLARAAQLSPERRSLL